MKPGIQRQEIIITWEDTTDEKEDEYKNSQEKNCRLYTFNEFRNSFNRILSILSNETKYHRKHYYIYIYQKIYIYRSYALHFKWLNRNFLKMYLTSNYYHHARNKTEALEFHLSSASTYKTSFSQMKIFFSQNFSTRQRHHWYSGRASVLAITNLNLWLQICNRHACSDESDPPHAACDAKFSVETSGSTR